MNYENFVVLTFKNVTPLYTGFYKSLVKLFPVLGYVPNRSEYLRLPDEQNIPYKENRCFCCTTCTTMPQTLVWRGLQVVQVGKNDLSPPVQTCTIYLIFTHSST